ncbi:UNVERIFIED_CONTAM: hypothetical protein GTU68_057156 [Idotea baltica]|nr:hypothetical protein [Idotea baltica]
MGNLRSVYKSVAQYCSQTVLSSRIEDVMKADKLILPGVGQFAKGMANLEETGLRSALEEKVLMQGAPILGICLGMQLFTEHSEEGDAKGLGWIEAKTRKFDASSVSNSHFKVPHMGWNTLEIQVNNPIYAGLSDESELYFCHSYYVECSDQSIISTKCHYGLEFCASIEQGNIYGMQFHPEKSHEEGARLIKNFIKIAVPERA